MLNNNTPSWLRAIPPVTRNLIIINVLIWLLEFIPGFRAMLMQRLALHFWGAADFNPAQIITYAFIHEPKTIIHVGFNMFTLWMFGEIIERSMGSMRFLIYYISCGLGAAFIQEGVFALMINHYASLFDNGDALCSLLSHTSVPYSSIFDLGISPDDPAVRHIFGLYHSPTVGASGAIYGILLAFGFLFPQLRIYLLFPPIPMKARTAVIVFAAIELALGIYNSQADTVAHFAHLGGMIVGLLILLWWRRGIPRY